MNIIRPNKLFLVGKQQKVIFQVSTKRKILHIFKKLTNTKYMINIMLKYNFRTLLRAIALLTILFIAEDAKSQVAIRASFRAMSFDEMLKPLQLATEAYNKAEKDFEEYYVKAITELGTNNPNYKLAIYCYDKCIELNTRFKGGLFSWGELLHQKGVCLNCTKDTIEANKCFFLAAQCYMQQKKYFNAIENLTLCLNYQYDGVSMYGRARCWDMIGNKKMSMKDYDTIISRGCTDKSILALSYNNRAYDFVKSQQYTEALPLANRAIELDNTISIIWDTRGELYYHLGEYEKCIQDMNIAISIKKGETSYGNSYYYRGLAKLKLLKKSEAKRDLKKAVKYGKIEAQEYITKLTQRN